MQILVDLNSATLRIHPVLNQRFNDIWSSCFRHATINIFMLHHSMLKHDLPVRFVLPGFDVQTICCWWNTWNKLNCVFWWRLWSSMEHWKAVDWRETDILQTAKGKQTKMEHLFWKVKPHLPVGSGEGMMDCFDESRASWLLLTDAWLTCSNCTPMTASTRLAAYMHQWQLIENGSVIQV